MDVIHPYSRHHFIHHLQRFKIYHEPDALIAHTHTVALVKGYLHHKVKGYLLVKMEGLGETTSGDDTVVPSQSTSTTQSLETRPYCKMEDKIKINKLNLIEFRMLLNIVVGITEAYSRIWGQPKSSSIMWFSCYVSNIANLIVLMSLTTVATPNLFYMHKSVNQ